MSDFDFAIGISHLPDDGGPRDQAMSRLESQLHPDLLVHVESRKATNAEWSINMWMETLKLARLYGKKFCLFLQDDTVLASEFWEQVPRMMEAQPTQVVCLHTPHPAFLAAYQDEQTPWAISYDALVGNGYFMPTECLVQFLRWRASALRMEARLLYPEDAQIALWCMATRRPIYHPMPSPIDHDTDVPSTYGHDKSPNRRPTVRFSGAPWPDRWDGKPPAVVGLVYAATFWQLRTHLMPEAVRKYRTIETMYELAQWRQPPG